MKKFIYYIQLVILVAFMASCSTSRRANKMPMVGNLTGTEYVEKIITSAPDWNSLSGKTSLELKLGNKGRTKANASLRIRRGEVIQLSVTPVLGIEVARLELTPQGLLLVDRMNKRFVRASFAEVSQLLHVDLDFQALQSLFLNELFLPGKNELSTTDVASFMLTMNAGQAKLQPKRMKRINYQFFTSAQNGQLEKTIVGLKGTAYSLDWDYSDFTQLEGRLFPRRTAITLQGTKESYALNLKMSRLSVDGNWSGRTQLSSRYKEISLEELLKVLFKL